MEDKASVIAAACEELARGDKTQAARIIREQYPFDAPAPAALGALTPLDRLKVFKRDGFVCRYSGRKVVFPPALVALSHALPDVFPYHPNWKNTACHRAYWELSAVVDHLKPVSRGGTHDLSNLVTTYSVKNDAKGASTLEELGWSLAPPGDQKEWDGLLSWFLEYAEAHPKVLKHSGVRSGHAAALRYRGPSL